VAAEGQEVIVLKSGNSSALFGSINNECWGMCDMAWLFRGWTYDNKITCAFKISTKVRAIL
jgi:hypothetical protein